jgi:hypothetical protein
VLDAEDQVSRFHLEFRRLKGGEAQVRNTGSNGATLNDAPLTDAWTALPDSCEIDASGVCIRAERV